MKRTRFTTFTAVVLLALLVLAMTSTAVIAAPTATPYDVVGNTAAVAVRAGPAMFLATLIVLALACLASRLGIESIYVILADVVARGRPFAKSARTNSTANNDVRTPATIIEFYKPPRVVDVGLTEGGWAQAA